MVSTARLCIEKDYIGQGKLLTSLATTESALDQTCPDALGEPALGSSLIPYLGATPVFNQDLAVYWSAIPL